MRTILRTITALAAALALHAAPAAAAQRADGTTVAVNGIQLHYREFGSGEPLLLLHGFGSCGMDNWTPFVAELSKQYRLIIPDLRGHGGSTGEDRFTHRASADDIIALLDHLKIGKARAMGISTGGMTLYHVATKAPERLQSLVVIGASDHFPQQARAITSEATLQTLPPVVQNSYRSCSVRGEPQVKGLINTFRGLATSTTDMNLTPSDFAKVKADTLVIHGDRDIFFPVSIPVGIYGAIPKAQLWIVPGGEHVPIYANQRQFPDVVLRFFGGKRP